jgi:hypothetical protein
MFPQQRLTQGFSTRGPPMFCAARVHFFYTVCPCVMEILPDIKNMSCISSISDSNYRCEKVFGLINYVKSRTKTRLSNEHLDRCMQIATTEIKRDIERLLKQNQC